MISVMISVMIAAMMPVVTLPMMTAQQLIENAHEDLRMRPLNGVLNDLTG
ncbi:hypothetical protein [Dickeya zeae]|nr:hypothetical protein [Dickeya zeae]